ncbi:MAG: RidA family protein [Rickettsiales bacterium]|nr:RidA family protein [Pseudomonadota bacterium]MDA0966627.1 RidA family protein [Pseudomonadota bacterium]MDG4543655.1 RidA family protein [Rickettsiales bacterium]MDG4545802.1 RidA family protein [Rickettsiales bacterium]MDG4547424.1 RidA family protein [Rickettsiales bacterium]
MSAVAKKLEELNIIIPEAAKPAANYVPYTISGNQIIISGQIPFVNGSVEGQVGKLGDNFSIEQGKAVAKVCAINIISQLKDASNGDLSKVKCVRLGVFVNSTPDFTEHPAVANGASDLIAQVFGNNGKHARAAVGVSSLPFGVAVEVEATFEFI